MTTHFYNPYHFVPFSDQGKRKKSNDLDPKDINNGLTQVRHDALLPELNSGTLKVHCRTLSPLAIGGEQKKGNKNNKTPNDIIPFHIGGELAIPGSSLRGMIASVAEILSDSPLRIANSSQYSGRTAMGDALSAIGEVEVDSDGKHFIIPLKVPTLQYDNKLRGFQLPDLWQEVFSGCKSFQECMGVYVGHYKSKTIPWDRSEYTLGTCYYGNLNNRVAHQKISETFRANDSIYHDKKNASNYSKFIFGQKLFKPHEGFKPTIKPEPDKYNTYPGVLYISGSPVEKHLGNKKHEWFIPYDKEKIKQRKRIPIPSEVLERFHTIAEARYEEDNSLPYRPVGSAKGEEKKFRKVQPGDLIYFDIEQPKGQRQIQVSNLAYSSLWRDELGESSNYLGDYGSIAQRRAKQDNKKEQDQQQEQAIQLSPAEVLFGIVEDSKKVRETITLASRLRFHNGFFGQTINVSEHHCGQNAIVLDTLNSPKAPSPAMYFSTAQGDVVNKQNMANPDQRNNAIPNGWKRYLPHPEKLHYSPQDFYTQGATDHLKSKVYPVAKGLDFSFEIDFHNLTDAELNLLCQSLNPGEDFIHRLGMGKPLGLGMVQVENIRIKPLKTEQRYQLQELNSKGAGPSIKAGWRSVKDQPWLQNQQLIDSDKQAYLLQLGRTASLQKDVPVQYPQAEGETDIFKWFVNNDKERHNDKKQYLNKNRSKEGKIRPLSKNKGHK